MKNCLIHMYVEEEGIGVGSVVCVECGRRHWREDRPVRIWAHSFIGRVVRRSDDDYNEWADLAMEARGRFLREIHL